MIDFKDPIATLAYALGIPVYVDADGRVSQHGPGRRVDPAPNALPRDHASPVEFNPPPTSG